MGGHCSECGGTICYCSEIEANLAARKRKLDRCYHQALGALAVISTGGADEPVSYAQEALDEIRRICERPEAEAAEGAQEADNG